MSFKGTPLNPVRHRPNTRMMNCGGCDKLCVGRDYYMVRDYVWFVEAELPHNVILCIACLETRLKRTLIEDDFSHCPLNLINGHRKQPPARDINHSVSREQVQELTQKSNDRPGDLVMALLDEAAQIMRDDHMPMKVREQLLERATQIALDTL